MKHRLWPAIAGLMVAGCATASPPEVGEVPDFVRRDEPQPASLDGSLHAYVAHALAARPELRAHGARWRADSHRIDAVDELPSPRIEYGYFVRSVETRVGPQRHRVMVRQSFFWPGKAAAAAQVSRASRALHEMRYDAGELEVAWQVADAYWAAWKRERIHRWHDEHVAIVQSLSQAARTRVEIGQAMVADVGQVELTLSRTVDMVQTAHQQHRRASIELRRAAALGEATQLPLEAQPGEPRLPEEPPESLVESAQQHPNIEAVRRAEAIWEERANVARKASYPDFTVGADWIETGAARDPTMEDSGKDPVIASIGLSVPIWNGENRALVDAANAEKEALEADVEAMRRDAAAAVHTVLTDIEESGRRVRLYQGTLMPQAEAVLGSVRAAYEVGGATISGVLHAQHEVLEIRIALVAAQAEHERAWAMLERLVGRPVEAEVMQ